MGTLGFFSHEGVLEVEKIEDSVDWYRPLPEFSDSDRYLQATFRYLMRFKKGENILADVG
ncbi:MAG: hypothetical protein QG650_820 [Patescibacteria group bacterium]|nr:hypothetical protein [Patescibacteria group bacterium]